jgi:hypothetical protein
MGVARPSCKYLFIMRIPLIENLRNTGQWKLLICELVLNAIHSPPGLDITFYAEQDGFYVPYSIDSILTIIVLFRLYQLFRVFLIGSFWANERATRTCRQICNTDGEFLFVLKCELRERPFTIIMISNIIIIFAFGYAQRAAEMPY